MQNPQATLSDLSIKNGESLTVDGESLIPEAVNSQGPVPTKENTGLRRLEVPPDNHCLFYSIDFLVNEGNLEKPRAKSMRKVIAQKILENPEKFSKVVLEKEPMDYAAWIQSDSSWGGAIELGIFSEHFRIEICAVDIQTTRIGLRI